MMYDRNEGVRGILADILTEYKRFDAAGYPFNAKFDSRTGKITHLLKGSSCLRHGIFNMHLDYYPMFSDDGKYIGWMSPIGFHPVGA